MDDLGPALARLGLGPSATGADVRRRYRHELKAAHPDTGGDPAAVREVVAAYQTVLAALSDDDALVTVPEQPAVEPAAAPDPDHALTLDIPVGEIFLRLHGALDTIGSITYSDAEEGLVEAILEHPGAGRVQLGVSIGPSAAETPVLFTLDSLDGFPAPPIEEVVSTLIETLRRG